MSGFQNLVDESGITRLRVRGGGTQPFKVVRIPIAFDTPNLTFPDGPLDIYQPTDGECLIGWWFSVPTTAWDGTLPTLSVGPPGDLGHYIIQVVSALDPPTFSGDTTNPLFPQGASVVAGNSELLHADAIQARIDDGSGGAPGSTQGAGEIVLLIIPAAA